MQETNVKNGLRIACPNKRLYTLREAGVYLGRSEYSVRTLVWNGQLPVVRHERKQWIDVQDLDSFVEKYKELL